VTIGDAIELIGYDVMTTSAHPGDEAMLRLYWQARASLPRNYSVFVHLINEDDVIIAQRDMYPGQGSLATSELTPGYTWRDHYALPIPHLTPAPQVLRWAVGMYDLGTGQRLTVTQSADHEQGVIFDGVELLQPTTPQPPLLAYGNGIALDSYELQPRDAIGLRPGGPLTVTLHWRADRQIDDDYTVSMQLLDEKANKIAQDDSAPAGGSAPTSSWAVGAAITDTHVLQVSADAPPGVYRLLLVLYSPKDFSRLGAYDKHGQYINTEVEMLRLRIH
jgi:hypothetical protein